MSQRNYISGRGNLFFYKPTSKYLAQETFVIVLETFLLELHLTKYVKDMISS